MKLRSTLQFCLKQIVKDFFIIFVKRVCLRCCGCLWKALQGSRLLQGFPCLHLTNFTFQHPLNLIAHGFSASIAEMYADNIGCLADFLHQCRSLLWYSGLCCVWGHIFVTHRGKYSFPGHAASYGRLYIIPSVSASILG